MRYTTIIAAPILAASAFISTQATAAIITACTNVSCVSTDENVLLNDATAQPVVSGVTNQSGVGVQFTSTANLLTTNNGQSSITSSNGLLEDITFTLLGGATFQTASFNLFPLAGNSSLEGSSVVFTFLDGSVSGPLSFPIDGNGNNSFGITAEMGDQLTSVTFLSQPAGTGIDSFRQLRFGGVTRQVAAVPEPATWAMMLFGFGAIGFAMRRRKSSEGGKRVRVAYS